MPTRKFPLGKLVPKHPARRKPRTKWPLIERIAVLSTVHQPLEVLTGTSVGKDFCVGVTEHGSLHYVPVLKSYLKGKPKYMREIMSPAIEDGLKYILFDRDGPIDPRFKIFEH